MKLHHVMVASLLALAAVGAQAATTLSLNASLPILSLGEGTTTRVSSPGDFSQLWWLDVDGENYFRISFEDVDTEESNLLNITDISVVDDFSTVSFSSSADGDYWVSDGAFVDDGLYPIMVSGTVTGTLGGMYATRIAPVPLPPAALLFGSALVGLAGLRRKKGTGESVEV